MKARPSVRWVALPRTQEATSRARCAKIGALSRGPGIAMPTQAARKAVHGHALGSGAGLPLFLAAPSTARNGAASGRQQALRLVQRPGGSPHDLSLIHI